MKKAKLITNAIFSSFLIVSGVFLIFFPLELMDILAVVLGILLMILGSIRVKLFLLGRESSTPVTVITLVSGLLILAGGILLMVFPGVIDEAVRIALAVWTFFLGGIQLLTAYAYYSTNGKRWIKALIWGLVTVGFSIVVFTNPKIWLLVLSTVVAAYCILLGIAGYMRLFVMINRNNKKRRNISMPLWLEISLPKTTLQWIKSTVGGDEPQEYFTNQTIPHKETAIEVLIHLSDFGTNALGHVDVVIDGQVFSYGNYDRSKSNVKLFGLFWDGVFAVCERDRYIKFSLEQARKTIICYTLQLDEHDQQTLKENVAEFLKNCEPWSPEDPKRNGYANGLKKIDAKLFKVIKGKFRTYFMLNTNCALLAEDFFEGTSIPKARAFGGTITPGCVLSLYENELKRKGSSVVKRSLYISERLLYAEREQGRHVKRELADLHQYVEHEISIQKLNNREEK
ncbi:MAG: DUF308 domain-containing protein [Christensenellaceae bacterium]